MKPILCNYYLTYRCNARCSFCTIWKDDSVPASGEAQVDVVRTNIDDIKRAGVKFIDFTGGEPLLYSGLPEVLRHAKTKKLRTTVTTNGILYPKRATELKGLVDILQFSIESVDRETHNDAKGVKAFDSVMESVDIARGLGERPTFIHTVTDGNIGSAGDVISLARTMKIPLFLNPCFAYKGTDGLSAENAAKLGKLATGKWVTVDRGYLKFIMDGGNKPGNPRCLAVSSTIVISPDDCLILPCFHFQMWSLPIQGKLHDLLKSDDVKNHKDMEGAHPFCEGCTVYCYMRASLYRKPGRYFLPTVFSGLKYLRELHRKH